MAIEMRVMRVSCRASLRKSTCPALASIADAVATPLLILLGGIAGLIAGSFAGALVSRWPEGRSIADGRSRCHACGNVLRIGDLVPVLSFVRLRGRCRECGAPIAPVHLVAELACALVGVTAFAAAGPPIAIPGAVFGWTLVALALLDLEHLWLPDRLTLPLAVLGLACAALGVGVPIRDSVIGATVGFASLALIALGYRVARGRTGMGAGDPKLFAAIGAWVGWTMLPPVLLIASVAGLAFVAFRRLRGSPVSATDRLPLGTLLALAAWPVWLVVTGLRVGE